MLKDAYCILCLKNDRRNINIYATELQYVYENLADFKVEYEGCWVCYVCHARLHQCQRLKQLAVSTRGLLNSCETKFEDKYGEFDTSLALCRSAIKHVSSLPAEDIKVELDDIKKEPTHDGDDVDADNVKQLITVEVPKVEKMRPDEIDQYAYPTPGSSSHLEGKQELAMTIKQESVDDNTEDISQGVGRGDDPDNASNCDSRKHTANAESPRTEELVCNLSPLDIPERTKNYTIQKQRKLTKTNDLKRVRSNKMSRGERTPYTCKVCAKNFRSKSSLERHFRVHTGDKPYSCDVCSKTFTQLNNLQAHVRIHKGDRPFTCDVCSKTFALKSYLRRHYSIHTEDKPYSCDVCSKKFAQRSVLKAHVKTHTGEKPYSCDACSEKFTQLSSLQAHASPLSTACGDIDKNATQ